MSEGFCIESMHKFIGTTVTIFTASGGDSGSGFTGVLAGICDGCVRLITCIGGAPCCPLGSDCDEDECCGDGFGFGFGFSGRRNFGGRRHRGFRNGFFNGNILGSVTNIPICQIVGFVHHAV